MNTHGLTASILLALAAGTASAQSADFYLHVLHHHDAERQLLNAGAGALEDMIPR